MKKKEIKKDPNYTIQRILDKDGNYVRTQAIFTDGKISLTARTIQMK